ncbi:hypothetical protein [Duganella sp. P38]|jgi:hypothetical protein|uniref:hypothetical protein n=1 Tax=Duganella sp. P38 TaxID=3423949 RepID=UPI003D78E2D5
MKLCGVEIPSDIDIPEIDPESKAELDEFRAATMVEREERKRRLAESPVADILAKIKTAPIPPHFDKPLTFSVEKLRLLSPWARARVLYVMRDQLTD